VHHGISGLAQSAPAHRGGPGAWPEPGSLRFSCSRGSRGRPPFDPAAGELGSCSEGGRRWRDFLRSRSIQRLTLRPSTQVPRLFTPFSCDFGKRRVKLPLRVRYGRERVSGIVPLGRHDFRHHLENNARPTGSRASLRRSTPSAGRRLKRRPPASSAAFSTRLHWRTMSRWRRARGSGLATPSTPAPPSTSQSG